MTVMPDAAELNRIACEVETLGHSIIEGLVSPALVGRLRAALPQALEHDHALFDHLPGKDPQKVENRVLHGGALLDLLEDPAVCSVFHALLDSKCIIYNYGSTVLAPAARPGAAGIHVDAPRVIPDSTSALNMTLTPDPFTDENGATQYLPGSHRMAETPDAAMFARHAVSVARPRGAALFLNPRSWHRAGFNATGELRCDLTLYAVRPFTRQRFDFPRFIPAEQQAALTPNLQSWSGFNARVPAAMDELFRPPGQRPYHGGLG